jgi:hypothetical protein
MAQRQEAEVCQMAFFSVESLVTKSTRKPAFSRKALSVLSPANKLINLLRKDVCNHEHQQVSQVIGI